MCSDCCNLWITNALIAHSHAHACTHVDRWVSDATRQIATHLANAILDVAQTKRRVPLCVYSSLLRSSMLCRLSLSLLFISSRSFLVLHPPSYFTQSTSCTSSFLIFLLTLFIVGSLSGFGVVLLVVQYIYAIATIIKHAQMMSDPIDYHSSGYDLDPERNFAAIKTRMGRNTAPKQQPNLSSSPPRGSLSEPPSPCLLPQSQLNSEPPSPSLVAAVRANETSDMANNASDASRGTMPVMHDDADQGRCFGSDDTRSDFSSSAIQYSYTALSTPVSRKSMASETTSTPASTPFRSVERPKTLAILKTQVTETGRPANPIFSLDLEASPMSLDDQSHFGDFDASDNTNSGCWTPNPKSDDAESIRSDSTLSPKAVLNLSSAAESDVHMTNVDAIDRSHPSACLFVASLSSAHTLESLRIAVMNVFAKWNPLDVTAHRDSSDRPYAFVQLRSYEDARDALRECRGALIFDRPIRCEHARVNRALFLASASRHLLRRDAENIFKKFGQLEFLISATIQYGRGNVRGWCAKFEYREDAIEAYFNLKPNEDCIIFYVQNPDPRIPTSMDNPSIFIRNLDAKRVTTELLQSRFATYGRIIDIELLNRSSSDSPAGIIR
ncbi:hypothetical protein V1520DRAFT_369003 [Lipomyces starkeyi]|uniref:RRM domain-containing protein n=1 Tax=Lipomyces starkeyi NRRL Y-11557 TaxID=675824 RepID=A0A1E3QB52_LIPST|nr:hypothetical protein LIPSTDRAFT_229324 [Lipomyces starkeyi NRRL Y-11557]